MRITGGYLRGRQLKLPPLPGVRPTTDRARESLFNWLSNQIDFEGLTVTELFAGTGMVSFEFISRGCPAATCVEILPACCRHITNVARSWEAPLSVVCEDAFNYIPVAGAAGLVFADPPYRLSWLHTLPERILRSDLLKNGGLLVLEHDRMHNFEGTSGHRESRRYGEGVFSIFEA